LSSPTVRKNLVVIRRRFLPLLISGIFFAGAWCACAQNAAPPAGAVKAPSDAISKKDADPEMELQKAIADAGNDRGALVRNLERYLQRFPDAPRKAGVFRALVESCEQVQDDACALKYSEELIALRPDDSEIMMLAVGLLQKQGDDASLTRASGYVSRVLDRIDKTTVAEKPPRVSPAEWQQHHDDLRAALYNLRGQIDKSQHDDAAAEKDLRMSYALQRNAVAAEQLGEIAEMRRDYATAAQEYLLAFVLPEDGAVGKVNRREIRKRLGNVWRQLHGSEDGLGAAVLAEYDLLGAVPGAGGIAAAAGSAAGNKNVKDVYAFVLRKLDGGAVPLAGVRGKVLVLSFWATWCGPCRELEPQFVQVAKNYAGNGEIVFYAVNTDEDESLVGPFLSHEKWDVPVVYADGLDEFVKVQSLPTVLIVDRAGKITYRINGYPPEGFAENLTNGIQAAVAGGASLNAN
jgi:cytochrome c biogenesis protein CcmG, thiol:disulfide interchange protein DsbE